jgi:hypothetical protein
MANSHFIPHDGNPTTATVKTGSYTVPAGSWAKVKAHCHGTATFTIDAIAALKTTQTTQTTKTASLLLMDNFTSGQLATSAGGTPGVTPAETFATVTFYPSVSEQFNVPTGTVLNVTGDARYTVELYPIIT